MSALGKRISVHGPVGWAVVLDAVVCSLVVLAAVVVAAVELVLSGTLHSSTFGRPTKPANRPTATEKVSLSLIYKLTIPLGEVSSLRQTKERRDHFKWNRHTSVFRHKLARVWVMSEEDLYNKLQTTVKFQILQQLGKTILAMRLRLLHHT